MDVNDEIVLDIGANIGDSAMYFCINGAKKVIAFEPYDYAYQKMVKNIAINGFEGRVNAIKAGVSDKDSNVNVPSGFISSTLAELENSSNGKSEVVPVYTLKTLFDKLEIQDAVLKMDCEGCEYDCIITSPNDTLRKIKRYAIEYHYTYEPSMKKFRDAGFAVKSHPSGDAWYNRSTRTVMTMGMIYASRED